MLLIHSFCGRQCHKNKPKPSSGEQGTLVLKLSLRRGITARVLLFREQMLAYSSEGPLKIQGDRTCVRKQASVFPASPDFRKQSAGATRSVEGSGDAPGNRICLFIYCGCL